MPLRKFAKRPFVLIQSNRGLDELASSLLIRNSLQMSCLYITMIGHEILQHHQQYHNQANLAPQKQPKKYKGSVIISIILVLLFLHYKLALGKLRKIAETTMTLASELQRQFAAT